MLAAALPWIAGLALMGAGVGADVPGNAGNFGPGSAWVMLSFGLALILSIVLLAFFCADGTRGPNRFGPDSKDPAGVADLAEVFR